MTWNDRWETKLFLGGQETAPWNGRYNVPFSTVFRSRAIAYITEDNFII